MYKIESGPNVIDKRSNEHQNPVGSFQVVECNVQLVPGSQKVLLLSVLWENLMDILYLIVDINMNRR